MLGEFYHTFFKIFPLASGGTPGWRCRGPLGSGAAWVKTNAVMHCHIASLNTALHTVATKIHALPHIGLSRVIEYSLLSISGCKFPFTVAFFAVEL